MQIIKNVLCLVFLLCMSNLFAMHNNKEGIYVFKDGVFCIVHKYNKKPYVNIFTGQIRDQIGFGTHYQSFQADTLQDCFKQFRVKDYQQKDIVFFHNGHYGIEEARKIFQSNNLFQKIQENRNKEIEELTEALIKIKNKQKKSKREIEASNMRNLLFTSVVVGSALVYVAYSLYKEYKTKPNNKTDDFFNIDDEMNEEDNIFALEELKEEKIEKERIA